jgi:hypothetical protein
MYCRRYKGRHRGCCQQQCTVIVFDETVADGQNNKFQMEII